MPKVRRFYFSLILLTYSIHLYMYVQAYSQIHNLPYYKENVTRRRQSKNLKNLCNLKVFRGFFWGFLKYSDQHCFICHPSDSMLCRGMLGLEPRTVGTLSLAGRRYNRSARSHPQHGQISSTLKVTFLKVHRFENFLGWDYKMFCFILVIIYNYYNL